MAESTELSAQQRWDALRKVMVARLQTNETLPWHERLYSDVGLDAIGKEITYLRPELKGLNSNNAGIIAALNNLPLLSEDPAKVTEFQRRVAQWDNALGQTKLPADYAGSPIFAESNYGMEQLVREVAKNPAAISTDIVTGKPKEQPQPAPILAASSAAPALNVNAGNTVPLVNVTNDTLNGLSLTGQVANPKLTTTQPQPAAPVLPNVSIASAAVANTLSKILPQQAEEVDVNIPFAAPGTTAPNQQTAVKTAPIPGHTPIAKPSFEEPRVSFGAPVHPELSELSFEQGRVSFGAPASPLQTQVSPPPVTQPAPPTTQPATSAQPPAVAETKALEAKTPEANGKHASLSETAHEVSKGRFNLGRRNDRALHKLDALEGKTELTREEAKDYIKALKLMRGDTLTARRSDTHPLSQYNTRNKFGRVKNEQVEIAVNYYDAQIKALEAMPFDKKNPSQTLALPPGLGATGEADFLVLRLNRAVNERALNNNDMAYLSAHNPQVRDDYLRTPNYRTREEKLEAMQQTELNVPKLDDTAMLAALKQYHSGAPVANKQQEPNGFTPGGTPNVASTETQKTR